MTGHKRKASQQLTSNSVSIAESITAKPPTMCYVFNFASWTARWVADMFPGWLTRPSTYTTMTYGSADVVTGTHIQSSQARDDGAVALKRQRKQKSTSSTRRSKSAVDKGRNGGQGKLDVKECATESEAQALIDAYWQPPEFGLLKRKSHPLQEQKVPRPQPGERQEVSMQRRHSGPAAFIPNARSLHKTPTIPRAFRPRGQSQSQQLAPDYKGSVEQQLKQLLLSENDDHEANRALILSDYKVKLRDQRAEELAAEKRAAVALKAKELRLSRRQPLKPLVRPLNRQWDRAVHDAEFRDNDFNRVITTSIGGTELRLKDFKTLLGPRSWLNDEIINSYIEWVVDAANKATAGKPVSKIPKFIGHNSFFYESLTKKGPTSTQRLMMRKKAPGISLMEVDSVLIPICRGAHWTVGVVRPVAKTIEYFDSLGGSPQTFVRYMREWLKFQLGDAYVEEEWLVPRTPCARQNNGYDCGVFVCTNAFCIVLGLDTSCYTEREMEQQRRNIAALLINRGFSGDFGWEISGL